jgi:hypothetical protein
MIFIPQDALAFSFKSLFNLNHHPHRIIRKPKTNTIKSQKKEPTHIKVGVYVLHVGKYDLQSASIRMDFYLILCCKPFTNKFNFEIMNATSSNIQLLVTKDNFLIYRVQAELNKSNNLRNYPFDRHALDIVIENRQLTSDELIFEADPSITALDSNLDVVGFQLLPNWSAKVTNHYYKVFKQMFSSYQFSMYIQRPLLAGILKGILPAFIITLCSFLALFMRIDHLSQRLSIATSTLIASVVFHLNLTASIPPLGYMTFADMFMFINYIFLFFILIEVIVITHFIETKHQPLAEIINWYCAWSIPLAWFVLQAINFLTFSN